MTIWELQEKTPEERRQALLKMSKEDLKTVIESCGTPQGKSAVKKAWEDVTGKK